MAESNMQYNVGALPIRAGIYGDREIPGTERFEHLHESFELILMRTGSMQYQVEQNVFSLKEGQLLFVNSGRVHKCLKTREEEATYAYLAVHPSLFSVQPAFLEKMMDGTSSDFLILSPSSQRQMKMTEKAEDAFGYILRKRECYEICVTGALYELFGFLYEYMLEASAGQEEKTPGSESLHAMVEYIQEHYAEKITLEILAAAGDTCRSRCCEYFKEGFHKSPNVYLTEYRLAKAVDLLLTTELGAKEIGKRCGFAGGSYFTETFRKYMQLTPLQYRQKYKK